jgi:hypothetical protein
MTQQLNQVALVTGASIGKAIAVLAQAGAKSSAQPLPSRVQAITAYLREVSQRLERGSI